MYNVKSDDGQLLGIRYNAVIHGRSLTLTGGSVLIDDFSKWRNQILHLEETTTDNQIIKHTAKLRDERYETLTFSDFKRVSE